MKQSLITYLLSLSVFCSISAIAQSQPKGLLPIKDGNVCFESVVEIDIKELEDHMASVLTWMSEKRISPSAPVRKEQDRIYCYGSGRMLALWGPNDYRELYREVSFDLQIVLKKDRLQYTFSNFRVHEQNKAYHLEIYKMENKRDLGHTAEMHRQIDSGISKYVNSLFLHLNIDSEKLISRG